MIAKIIVIFWEKVNFRNRLIKTNKTSPIIYSNWYTFSSDFPSKKLFRSLWAHAQRIKARDVSCHRRMQLSFEFDSFKFNFMSQVNHVKWVSSPPINRIVFFIKVSDVRLLRSLSFSFELSFLCSLFLEFVRNVKYLSISQMN